jgi:signal transduction histidine kinase/ligand-binding sensor domain-containing protein/DNA-binding response OmpR family regulator
MLSLFVLLDARSDIPQFEHISYPMDNVMQITTCILQDSRGVMWFGTGSGLFEYDGYQFKHYWHIHDDPNSLSDNFINVIYEDISGILWIGTDAGGLNRFDISTQKFTHFMYRASDSTSLSNNKVRSICGDSAGTLWIGTDRGINKLVQSSVSGIESEQMKISFVSYIHDPTDSMSMYHNVIFSIFRDRYGVIWFGTGQGLKKVLPDSNLESPLTIIQYMLDPLNPMNERNVVTSIVEDNSGELWLGTVSGLNRLIPGNSEMDVPTFQQYVHDANNSASLSNNWIEKIYADNSGALWILTHKGLNKFEPNAAESKFTRFTPDPDDPSSIGGNVALSIYEDKSGVMWIGTNVGLEKITPANGRGSTLSISQYKHNSEDPLSLSDNKVSAIFESARGDLWVGTNRGLNRLVEDGDEKSTKFEHYSYGLDDPDSRRLNFINSIVEDNQGNLLIGTGRGMDKLVFSPAQFKHNKSTAELTPPKIIHYSVDHEDSENRENWITSVIQDSSGMLWVGSSTGLGRQIPPTSGKPADFTMTGDDGQVLSFVQYLPTEANHFSILNNCIYKDMSNAFWIGTSNGLYKTFNTAGTPSEISTAADSGVNRGVIIHFNYRPDLIPSLSNNSVTSIYEDNARTLWVGTYNGLNKLILSPTAPIKRYRVIKDSPNDVISGILEDSNENLWISTIAGLYQFNPDAETFKRYDLSDGLPSIEFNPGAYYKRKSGEMYFGTRNGMISFFPDSVQYNPYLPQVILTDFKLFNKSVEISPVGIEESQGEYYLPQHISVMKKIELSFRHKIFSFEFAALDYSNPTNNQYAYKMEGFNEDWISTDASQRTATYTNLDPGEYTFKVKGSNNDGIWNELGTSLRVIITPPWWQTMPAYTGYFMLTIAIFTIFYRLRLARVYLQHQIELEHLEAERYHELDEHKSRFMANISHEFRTPLTLILGPVSNLLTQVKDHDMRADLQLIQRQGKRLLELVIQVLDISKLEDKRMNLQASQQNIVPLLKGLVLSFASLAERNKIDLKFESEMEDIQLYVERDAVVKILNNLLSNAFKFSETGDSINVGVSQCADSQLCKDGEVMIRVSDTGIGIPKNHLTKVFDRFHQVDNTETRQWGGTGIGLSLTKELVELHGGTISVDSNPDVGTIFTICLPRGKDHLAAHEIVQSTSISAEHTSVDATDHDSEDNRNQVERNHAEALPILLIVEDNLDVRNYIRSYLDKSYQCYEAVDGQDGLNKVRQLIPDLVISDIMMPKMNGLEFCRHMKTDERTSHIPVLMLTAKADMGSKVKGLETGADAYLTKPFEAIELKIRIKNLIDQRQALRERFQKEFNLIPADLDISSMDRQFLQGAIQIISDKMDDPDFKVDMFSQKIFMSRQQLNRKLKALTGRTAVEFVRLIRLKRAAVLLKNNHASITEIAYQVGFSNPSHFSRSFHDEFGKTPTAFISEQNNGGSD